MAFLQMGFHGRCLSTPFIRRTAGIFVSQLWKSGGAEADSSPMYGESLNQEMEFPGGRVAFTPEMRFLGEYADERVPCFRVLDNHGFAISNQPFHPQPSKEEAIRMYKTMVKLQTMDSIFFEAQRQGRLSFYVTSSGEEAINIGAAAAMSQNDVVLPQYREQGVLLWRGFTIREFANQCFGNREDYGKGRQMPIHYGSKKLNYFTISSPIGTQLPQAAGVAYSLKMENKDACVVTFFGDGGSSEGDCHAGLNFAAVLETPVVFICRNNGWAISTPTDQQFKSDGIVVRGRAYGIPSIRVDGNDALAVYAAVSSAREMAIEGSKPVLVEVMSYRVGHHSTSDDSTKYRPVDEIEYWKIVGNPIIRLRKWVERNGWWDEDQESDHRSRVRDEVLEAIMDAEKVVKPRLSDLFSDVYDVCPENLVEQERFVRDDVKRHPLDYPNHVPS